MIKNSCYMLLLVNVIISPSRYSHRVALTIQLLPIQGRRCRGSLTPSLGKPEWSTFRFFEIFKKFFFLTIFFILTFWKNKVPEIRGETEIGGRCEVQTTFSPITKKSWRRRLYRSRPPNIKLVVQPLHTLLLFIQHICIRVTPDVYFFRIFDGTKSSLMLSRTLITNLAVAS